MTCPIVIMGVSGVGKAQRPVPHWQQASSKLVDAASLHHPADGPIP
jgi:hypothetical protein